MKKVGLIVSAMALIIGVIILPMFRVTPLEFVKEREMFSDNKGSYMVLDHEGDVYVYSFIESNNNDFFRMNLLNKSYSSWNIVNTGGHSENDVYSQMGEPGEGVIDFGFSLQLIESPDTTKKSLIGVIKDETILSLEMISNVENKEVTIFSVEDDKKYFAYHFDSEKPVRDINIMVLSTKGTDEIYVNFESEEKPSNVYYHYDLSHVEYNLEEIVKFAVIGDVGLITSEQLYIDKLNIKDLTIDVNALYDGLFVSEENFYDLKSNYDEIFKSDQDIYVVYKGEKTKPFIVKFQNGYRTATYNWIPSESAEMNYYRAVYHILSNYRNNHDIKRHEIARLRVENDEVSFNLSEEDKTFLLDAIEYVDYLSGAYRIDDKKWHVYCENDLETLLQYGVYYKDEQVVIHDVTNDKYGYIKVFDQKIKEMFDSYN